MERSERANGLLAKLAHSSKPRAAAEDTWSGLSLEQNLKFTLSNDFTFSSHAASKSCFTLAFHVLNFCVIVFQPRL